MNRRVLAAVSFLLWTTAPAAAEVLRVTDLTTAQIRALDRSKTLVVLSGGMLEEHGPYLPAYTDGVLSDRLTQELTRAVATERSGWTVLLFPQIPFGASGYNEIGGHYVFPGTYAVRPSTLRAVFMDLASELGKKGAADRYAAFLDLAPSLIAREARQLQGRQLERALDAYAKARELATVAPRLSLDPAATVFQIGGILASVPEPASLKR